MKTNLVEFVRNYDSMPVTDVMAIVARLNAAERIIDAMRTAHAWSEHCESWCCALQGDTLDELIQEWEETL